MGAETRTLEVLVNSDFWRDKRVFLTGHTGFKGSWLALWLSELGARVHGFALEPPTEPSLFRMAGIESRLASHTLADVRDAEALAASLARVGPDVVFHLAAQPLVRESYRQPRATFETNLMGTVNLLEAVRVADSVRVCQVITSDKCYENREWLYGYRESDPMGGHDPYSSSKGCAELAVAAYGRSFFSVADDHEPRVSLASARAGNVIGGGDWAEDRLVPDCVRAFARGERAVIRNPWAVRPWQHVLEPLSGYLLLAERQRERPVEFSGAWNFGPRGSDCVSVGAFTQAFVTAWGVGAALEPLAEAGPDAPHEAGLLRLDITKAETVLGWSPRYDLRQAVDETVAWYREAGRTDDVQDLCVEQLRRFEMARRTE